MNNSISVAHGREYLAIPGPSVIPDKVLQAMHRPSPNIYAGELPDLTDGLIPDLRKVARTRHHVAIYISNGHGAWEAALSNVIEPEDRILVLATGRFGHGWGEMASGLGASIDVLDFGKSSPLDLEKVRAVLQKDNSAEYKAILATHVDTSSSVRNDIAGLRSVLDAVGHPALLMVDCIASLGCDRFEMDEWGVDIMVAGCQKGLMVPPGLGFVFFNDKAAARRQTLKRVSRYWDWIPRANPAEFYQYFGGTAPTHHLYGLRAALDMILEEGVEHVWERHARLAGAVWAACDAWGQDNGSLRMNIANPIERSHAVTALRLETGEGTALRQWLEENMGLTLGIGLGMAEAGDPARDAYFRLGHMGHVNGQMIMGLLGGIETGLSALGVARGQGAIEAAAAVISGRG